MEAQLQEEAKEDEDLYDKLVCWCETNDKEKTKEIADGKQSITELTAAIEENTALASTRETEIGELQTEVAGLEKALEEAGALRAKETAEFNDNEKNLIQSISSLKGAVSTLGKVHGEASLVQRQEDALLQQPVSFEQESAPQSGAIFGILKQMKETFETNMETGKKEEAQSAADFDSLSATKNEQLKAAKDKIFTKSEELAKANEVAATSKESLDDTSNTLAANTEFLANLKKQCADIDSQWEARTKMRSEEITAVSETIGILTDDDAKDTFSSSLGLMQARALSKQQTRQRETTAAFLADAGHRLHSRRLSYLAVRVRNDAFAKVKESIEGMVGVLGEEQKDEVTKKDGCVSDFNTNEKQ